MRLEDFESERTKRENLVRKNYSSLLGILLVIGLVATGCASSGGGGGADAVAAAPDYTQEVGDNGLLTPRAILARYTNALGGEAAIKAHSSSTSKGLFALPAMGIEGEVVIYSAAPNKTVMNIEMGGMGSMSNGYNGDIGWSVNPMTGASLLEGSALNLAAQQAAFYGPLAYGDLFTTMETVEKLDFEGQSAYKVKFGDADGGEVTQFFSEESGLQIGFVAVQDQGMGPSEVTTVLSDYQDFGGGVKVPGKVTLKVQGMEIIQTTSSVTYDDVDASSFEPPAEVQSLL